MKNLLIVLLVIFGMTSCSKDSLDIVPQLQVPKKSEIMVRVSYLSWSDDQCEPGCGGGSYQEVSFIPNANVTLYEGELIESDALTSAISNQRTDHYGTALLEDLEPGIYTLWVETPLGEKTRTVTTIINKRSNIDFSF